MLRSNLLDSEAGYEGGAMQSGSSSYDEQGVKKYFSTAPAPISRRTLSILLIALSLLSIILLALAITVARDQSSVRPTPLPVSWSSSSAPTPPASLSSSSPSVYSPSSSPSFSPSSSSSSPSALSPSSSSSSSAPAPYTFFASKIGVPDLWRHLNALQSIADANNGTRAIGSPGFNASVDYIFSTLQTHTHFDVTQHTFPDTAWLLSEPYVAWGPPSAVLPQAYQTAYHVMTYSGSVHTRNAVLVTVDGGCSDANYTAFPRGAVALTLMTPLCSNAARATRAANFGAAAILVYQLRTTRTFLPGGVTAGTAGATIGAFLLPFTTGIALAELVDARGPGGVIIDLNLTTTRGVTGVTNTCATSRYGNPNRTIVSGSHCDSVPAGAGVNDNGSGTALNLALALALNQWEEDPMFVPFRKQGEILLVGGGGGGAAREPGVRAAGEAGGAEGRER